MNRLIFTGHTFKYVLKSATGSTPCFDLGANFLTRFRIVQFSGVSATPVLWSVRTIARWTDGRTAVYLGIRKASAGLGLGAGPELRCRHIT